MGKFDRRSRDQKRKAKLAKRAQRSRPRESLAYHGNKYKTDAMVPVVFRTETGIYETFVMTDRRLTDDQVTRALEGLITRMRQGPLPLPSPEDAPAGEGEDELIVWNIRRNWVDLADLPRPPTRDDLIGVLRTILGSIEVWTAKAAHSQGYLRYIEGFLRGAGVSVQKVDPSTLLALDEEEDEDPLLELGWDWLDGVDGAEAEFHDLADRLLQRGEAERVLEVCQELIGEARDPAFSQRLQPLWLRAHQAAAAGPGPGQLPP